MKQQLKNQHDDVDCDSRMDSDRMGGAERSGKKAGKGKAIRGSSKSGGSSSFWKQWNKCGESLDRTLDVEVKHDIEPYKQSNQTF